MTTTIDADAVLSNRKDQDGLDGPAVPPRASTQTGEYPRPQMLRQHWADLDGVWDFRYDDADEGAAVGWHRSDAWAACADEVRDIVVPFPPESPASGIGDTGFHPVVWYRRTLTRTELDAAGYRQEVVESTSRARLLVHFGAVDYRCRVWLAGIYLGEHVGGHTPFSFDLTDALRQNSGGPLSENGLDLVVRAEDDPADVEQPRGKQDWQVEPHVIWYHRTTGIWQTVWLEAVPEVSVHRVQWMADLTTGCVRGTVELTGAVARGTSVRVALDHEGEALGAVTVDALGASRIDVTIAIPGRRNGQAFDYLVWSPEVPRLIDATVEIIDGDESVDMISSYLGFRSVETSDEQFLLNDAPYYVRSVLSQGYWPESHLAAPSRGALRREVELIKELGFNAARVHQKIEDPRFLYWADRLGLLIWGETPGAFAFSNRSVQMLVREWMDAVERDLSHPSIVTWVPVNESWGVQHIAHDPAQQAYSRSLTDLTRALDPSRPVISNDGWEHQNSDIITIHDYQADGDALRATYADAEARIRLFDGFGPAGRRVLLNPVVDDDRPVMLTEFGGIHFAPGPDAGADSWGYSHAQSAEQFAEHFGSLLAAVHASSFLAGFCYTQLTDTRQEANGLLTELREPKIPFDVVRAAVQGTDAGRS